MKNNFLLGVDLGTTVCKAGIYSQKGELVSCTNIEYGLIKKGEGIVEQDASKWWDLTLQAIKTSIKEAKIDKNLIKALSISSQGISFVPVDRKINPLCRSISWLDTRAKNETNLILDKIPFSRIFAITGKRPHPSYTLPKILWLMREKPEIVDKTYKFLMPHDFLIAKFTGEFLTDHTMAAGTLMYDINNLDWSDEIMGQFNIPVEKLPSIRWAGTPAGKISQHIAQKIGLSPETLVIVGGQDQKCAVLGAGLTEETAVISLGTAVAISRMKNKPVIDEKIRIPCFPYLVRNNWILEGVVSTGGGSFQWLKQILSDTYGYEKLTEMAKESPIGAAGVFFFPHLSGAASPHWKSQVKGFFYGLSLSTSTKDLVRSVLEGVAFQIRENLEVLEELTGEVKKIKIFGGGAKSEFWGRIITNVTGKRTYLLSLVEAATVGACLVAGVGGGVYASYEEATRSLKNLSHIKLEPDIYSQRKYQKLYLNYRKVEEKIIDMI